MRQTYVQAYTWIPSSASRTYWRRLSAQAVIVRLGFMAAVFIMKETDAIPDVQLSTNDTPSQQVHRFP